KPDRWRREIGKDLPPPFNSEQHQQQQQQKQSLSPPFNSEQHQQQQQKQSLSPIGTRYSLHGAEE
ncbi:hypothetical protein ElyMa_002113000, partial [Elysia marginata]